MGDVPLVELHQVSRSFTLSSGHQVRALRRVDLTLNPNEILVILGPSGAGKSTCLKVVAGLVQPDHGLVMSNGIPLRGPNPDVAMVFQFFALLPWLNVFQNISLGLSAIQLSKMEVLHRVDRVMDLMGLTGFEKAYPRELSGGMKQRVGIARALVMERKILCLDEPFSALDILMADSLRKEVLSLWLTQRGAIQSILMITHNITEAVLMGNRIVVMGSKQGEIQVIIKNDLPYPRDERSAAFKHLVDDIHDVITQTIIPETKHWVPPAFKHVENVAIPPVFPNQVADLLDIIAVHEGRVDAFAISQLLNQDSIQILMMAKAAELFDLVDTPHNEVVLTELGKKFVCSSIEFKKRIIHEQMNLFPLVQVLRRRMKLRPNRTISSEEALELIQDLLPNENSDQVMNTLIQWARFGDSFSYDDDKRTLQS